MPFPLPRLARHSLAALAFIVLAGCGFHLRGPQPLDFSTLYIGVGQYSPLGTALRRQVALSGTTTVEEDTKRAEVSLQILANERTREILSLTPAGKVREYELGQRIRFRLADRSGSELIPPTNITARREYTFNDELILGKEQEEALLYRDMENDLVRQIMRRLAAWRRTAETRDPAQP
ncbi:MAG: LPS assembly lipoprotein LptE [Azoarcus sp.]|jgi:LPS-assembly lipoprotein|nr:LPS assembly lipoprotein LptE [Azoarcus sp.]